MKSKVEPTVRSGNTPKIRGVQTVFESKQILFGAMISWGRRGLFSRHFFGDQSEKG